MPEHVFVYGTLRRNFSNRGRDVLTTHGRFLGEAEVRGRLYDLGSFPALVDEAEGRVRGEVYRLTHEPERGLERLDRYEGARGAGPGPYVREARTAILDDGEEIEAWVYIWTDPVEDLDPIPGGDYVDYLSPDWRG